MSTAAVDPYPEAVPPTTNAAGRASLVVAVVIVVVEVGQLVVSQSLPLIMRNAGLNTTAVGVIFGIFGAVVGLLAIVGLILGIIGLSNSRASRASAGAGTAIAASSLLNVALSFSLPWLINALY